VQKPTAIALASGVICLLVAGLVTAVTQGTPGQTAAPEIRIPAELRVEVGERLDHRFEGTAAEGTGLRWAAEGLPSGARLTPDGRLAWSPTLHQAGTWTAEVTATDAEGRSATSEVRLLGRHTPRPELYVALGDSVASGHGLDWRGYLRRGPCWRDHTASYPAQLLELAREASASIEVLALLACSGHGTADLAEQPVDGGPDLGAGGGARTQLDRAVAANPGLVTLTIGANDLGFARPERAVGADGGLDEGYVRERLARVEAGLVPVLARLVEATDAQIIVTTYHDPTAERPHGVDGCRRGCFRAITGEVVARLNGLVEEIAGRFPADRVTVADVTGAFAGRGAPNGRGLDVLRGWDAPSWVPAPLTWTSGIHAYCAVGRPDGPPSYVSSVDCVHPNAAGARAYAAVALDAWSSSGWPGAPDG
jgi:lysophospholipase L1-like esterase